MTEYYLLEKAILYLNRYKNNKKIKSVVELNELKKIIEQLNSLQFELKKGGNKNEK